MWGMSTQTRVTKGVREGGQFKATAHTESSLTLTDSAPAGPSPAEEIEALVGHYVQMYGPGMEPHAREQLKEIDTEGGKLLWARARLSEHRDEFRYQAELKPEMADAVHKLGFETANDLLRAKLVGAVPKDLVNYGIDRDRVKALAEAFPDPQGWYDRPLSDSYHQWYQEAAATAPVEDVIAVHSRRRGPDRWRDMVGLANPTRAARAQQFLDAGCFRIDWVTSGHSPEDLMAMSRAGGTGEPSQRNTDMALHRLESGLNPEDLRDFGVRFVDRFGAEWVQALRQNRVDPKAVKTIHNAIWTDLETEVAPWTQGKGAIDAYRRLVAAGVKTRAAAEQLYFTAENIEVAEQIQSTLGAARAAEYRQATSDAGEWRRYTKERVQALATFDKSGGTPEQLVSAGRSVERETLRHIEYQARGRDHLADVARAMTAGVSAERIQTMSRAGIPPLALVEHKDATDLWAAGAPYREAHAKEEARLAQSPLRPVNHQVKTWPWTEADVTG